jgi:class 3 adenylate cyclase
MMLETVKSQPQCVLFCDIADSTRLYEQRGNTEASRTVRRALEAMAGVVRASGGRVVKTLGDGVLARFDDAAAAADAARALQFEFREGEAMGLQLALRVGFQHGHVLLAAAGDVFGDAVNVAARLVALAAPGQSLTTRDTVALLAPAQAASMRSIGSFHLKGKDQPAEVYELQLAQPHEATIIMPQPAAETPATMLVLSTPAGERVMVGAISRLTLGRGAQCDIVLGEPQASRLHAVIERRGDAFALIDQSSNGTFVRLGDAAFLRVSRQEVLLHGQGCLRFVPPEAAEVEPPGVGIGFRVAAAQG